MPAISNENFVINHLEQAQETSACHLKEAILLKENLEKGELLSGLKHLEHSIHVIFLSDFKTPNIYVDRAIMFLGVFCSLFKAPQDSDRDHPCLIKILDIVLKYVDCVTDSMRFWSCKLIKEILSKLHDLSNESFHNLREALLERLDDPNAAVRLQSIQCLEHMQKAEDIDDPIIEKFIQLMQTDLKPKIRAGCVKAITLRKNVLQALVTRTRDVNKEVQLLAYNRIAPNMTYLTIIQRREVVENAHASEYPSVKNYFSYEFFNAWLGCYGGDFLKLSRSLQLYEDEVDIEQTCALIESSLFPVFINCITVENLLDSLQLNTANKTVDFDDLTIEVAMYWRFLVEYLKASPEFEYLFEQILPEVPIFCKYINDYYSHTVSQEDNFAQNQFVLKQLFLMLKLCEVSDPTCRISILNLVEVIFKNAKITTKVAEAIMQNLERIIVDASQRSEFICEITSHIRFGINDGDETRKEQERNEIISQLKAELTSLDEILKKSVEQHDFLKAEHVQSDIDALKGVLKFHKEPKIEELHEVDDAEAILRALTLLEALLLSSKIKEINPSLSTILSEFVLKTIAHLNESIQVKALMCYCLIGIIDKQTASHAIHIIALPVLAYHNKDEVSVEVLLVCIGGISDMLMAHGSNLVATQSSDDFQNESMQEETLKIFTEGTCLSDLLQGLADLMDDELECIQKRAVESIGKLLLTNKIHSINLLARLILKWANPATDDDVRSVVGVILERLHGITNYARYFQRAVIPVIETIANAPTISPLANTNLSDVADFLVALTFTNSSVYHTDLASDLCRAIIEKPRGKQNPIYCKVLVKLKISVDPDSISELLDLCEELRDTNCPRNVLREVTKFNAILTNLRAQCNGVTKKEEID